MVQRQNMQLMYDLTIGYENNMILIWDEDVSQAC